MNEFEIIEHYFQDLTAADPRVVCNIGDDAAVISVPPQRELVVSIDTLVGGVHFLADVDPAALGHKALAVNLSDLAAMGAQPAWMTMSLTMPGHNPEWLRSFTDGFARLARHHGISLVGGDLSSGPLSITVQVMGLCEPGQALTRRGARVGDDVYLSGYPGEAGYGLLLLTGSDSRDPAGAEHCLERLLRPSPRVDLGLGLLGIAHAAIDISDGVAADLNHITDSSAVAAEIQLAALPLRPPLSELESDVLWNTVLTSGDDYELCFTVSPSSRDRVEALSAALDFPLTRIGRIVAGSGVRFLFGDGTEFKVPESGYQHF